MKIDPQIAVTIIILILLIVIGSYGFLGMKRQPKPPIDIARQEAKMSGGILTTNSVVFECDFVGCTSAKVYCFQHNGKDHYVVIGRNGGVAIK